MSKVLFDIALKKHQQGQLDEAEKLYKQILQKEPQNADVLHLYGILCAQQHDYQAALKVLQRATELSPTSTSYLNSLSNVYTKLGQLELAAETIQKAILLQPNNATLLSNLGNVLYQQQRFAEAKKHYQAALRQNPKLADAHYNLALLATRENEITTALEHLDKVLAIDEHHTRAHGLKGQLLQQQNQITQAIIEQQKQIEIEPFDSDARTNLASALLQQGDVNEAINQFKRSLEIDPSKLNTWHNLAAAYMQIKEYDEALAIYLNLIEQSPAFEYYFNIGVIYMDKDHHKEAIEYFKKALALKPDDFDTHINLATTYLKQQDYSNTITHYKAAQQLQPDNPEITYILTALEQGSPPKSAPTEYIKHLFDQYAPHFDLHLQQHLHYHVPKLLFNAITVHLNITSAQWKILDLGCGTGLTGIKLKPLAAELIGIDLSEKMLTMAKEKNIYDRLESMSIDQALRSIQQLDLIIAGDVFSYVGDLEDIFRLSYQALNPNGLFAFTTEICYQQDYVLQKTARFAHSSKYITELAAKHHFTVITLDNAELRTQHGKPLEGYVVLLTKNSA